MKTVFDKVTREELIKRINSLDEHSAAQWGKMTVYQMLKHCAQWDEMAQGKRKYKQSLMGRIFGKIAMKNMLKDTPLKRNMPTVPEFVITGAGDVAAEKANWVALVEGYANYADVAFIHPFFGQMSKEDTGRIAYKHADHHLTQFNA